MVVALKISVAFKILIMLDVVSWLVMVVSGRDVFCSSSFVFDLFFFFKLNSVNSVEFQCSMLCVCVCVGGQLFLSLRIWPPD